MASISDIRQRTTFDIANWYWIVDGDKTKVYSSTTNTYVSIDDATYKIWVAGGGRPTNIINVGELDEVLAKGHLPASPHI